MLAYQVNDMTCGHCVAAITQAVLAVDPGARVAIDLAGHRVEIGSTIADVAALGRAIAAAGYTPLAIAGGTGPVQSGSAPTRVGCCCS